MTPASVKRWAWRWPTPATTSWKRPPVSKLTRLDSADVDVVVLDLMLPGIDGLRCVDRLRAAGDLPIIIVSARTDTADVIEGWRPARTTT